MVLGSGISGLLNVKTARAMGAGRIIATDINEYRLAKAREFGADITVDGREDVVAKSREGLGRAGADLVILCTGAPKAIEQGLEAVDRGGTVLFFAPPDQGVAPEIPINDFWRNEVKVKTTYAGAPSDILTAIDMIGSGRIEVSDMITHVLPLERTGEGFALVEKAQDSIKVIIEP